MQHLCGKRDSVIRPLVVLRGRAPQFKDWLDAWSEVTEKMAFIKVAYHSQVHTRLVLMLALLQRIDP